MKHHLTVVAVVVAIAASAAVVPEAWFVVRPFAIDHPASMLKARVLLKFQK